MGDKHMPSWKRAVMDRHLLNNKWIWGNWNLDVWITCILYIYVRTYACMCICMYMYVYMYVYIYVCICMYMHVYACICMYCICMYMYVYVCICMYLYVCVYVYIYIHIYIYMYYMYVVWVWPELGAKYTKNTGFYHQCSYQHGDLEGWTLERHQSSGEGSCHQLWFQDTHGFLEKTWVNQSPTPSITGKLT